MMKAISLTAFATLAVFVVVSALPAESAGVELRYKFNEGDVLVIESTEKSAMTIMEMEMGREQVRTMEWKIVKVEEGIATVEVKITRVRFKENNPMTGEVDYDSESDEEPDNAQAQVLGIMVGKKFTIKMDERGKVVDVKGFTKIGEQIMAKMEEAAQDNPQAAMAMAQMRAMFTDEAMKKQLDQSSTAWPKESVDVGSEWNQDSSTSVPMMGKLNMKMKNKIDAIEEGVVKGSFSGKMDTEEDDEGDEGGMGAMIQILDGKITGTFEFDTASGQLVKRVQKIKMNVKTMMGQEMPVVTTTIQELKKHTHATGKKDEGSGKEDGDF
jgi:hypothetical protein